MTIPTRLVLEAMLVEPDAEQYGAALGALAGLPSGTVHPILARLEGVGWVESRWEDIDPSAEGRPRRRYYRLSDEGRAAAARAVESSRQRTPARLRTVQP